MVNVTSQSSRACHSGSSDSALSSICVVALTDSCFIRSPLASFAFSTQACVILRISSCSAHFVFFTLLQFVTYWTSLYRVVGIALRSGLVVGTQSNVHWTCLSPLLGLWWSTRVWIALPVLAETVCDYGASSDTPDKAFGVVHPQNFRNPRNGVGPVFDDYCYLDGIRPVFRDCW